ncbi:MAG TPA: Crp/Fnr family transcriptional regulator [Hydrogenophaga sp.]|nr:Crp/Fnr family transcriptional regulator [Hydrogenophaga sp.]
MCDVFQRLAGCELPEWPLLEAAATERRLARGEALFTAGEELPCVFVVTEGIVKMVYETPKGDAWVKGFAEAGVCFASLSALEAQGRTSFSAYAEVPSLVHQVRYATLIELANRHLPWQRAVANAMRIYGQRKEKRELELLTLSPTERYLRFLQEHPALVKVLRQRDVASYIRVTPVALSRIKSRLLR